MFMPRPQPALNKVVTVPAPIGGLNARDSLVAMPETDAIVMRNLWPQPYGCAVRKGFAEFAVKFPTEVATLANWASATGTQKFFAWSASGMYDITSGGAVGAAIVTGLLTSTWQTVAMTNSAGAHLIAVSGLDDGIIYNLSGVARLTLGDGITTNTWKNISPQSAVQATVHQGRLWVVEKNSARGWYLPVGQIFGIFLSFDFGPLFSRGGFLQYLFTWTLDDGNGAEDHLVAVSSEGEVVAYAGTDPNTVATWGLVGVYYAGAPVSGRRSFTKLGGDMALITQRGVVSLTNLLASTKVNQEQSIIKSSKIQFLISEATTSYSDLAGWQLVYIPTYNMLLLNIPSVVAAGNFQFAANEVMPAEPWTQFVGMDASCWLVYDNKLYFGDYLGNVYEAWVGNADNVRLPLVLDVNPDFTGGITNWSANGQASLSAGTNTLVVTQAITGLAARGLQDIVGDYSNQVLRLTATYRNISGATGAYVRAVVQGAGTILATLPVNLTTNFVTNSIDFLCTTATLRIQASVVDGGTITAGPQVEFDSVTLTIAPIGTDIDVECQQAYSYLGALSMQKQVGMFRPNFVLNKPVSYGAAIVYDFEVDATTSAPASAIAPSGSLWDAARWDTALWGGGLNTDRVWRQASGIGVAASLLFVAQTDADLVWISTDYSYKVGTLL